MDDFSDDLFHDNTFNSDNSGGICFVCGQWNCEEHKEDPRNKMFSAANPNPDPNVGFFGIIAPISRKLAQEISEGKRAIFNTGEEKTADPEKDTEEEEQEEEEEEEEKLNLPPISIMANRPTYREMEDKDKAHDDSGFVHLDLVFQDMISSALDGTGHSFKQFRAKKDSQRVKVFSEEAKSRIPKLRRRLILAFEAEARTARQRGLKRGSLDQGRQHLLVTEGKADVFAKKANRRDISTAISVVMDDSFSMQETAHSGAIVTSEARYMTKKEILATKFGCVGTLAYALGEVANGLNVATEFLAYERSLMNPERSTARLGWGGHYAIQFKAFHESWKVVRDRLGSYYPYGGGSLTYEAAAFASNRLAKRPEERKILFHLSDADADNTGMEKLHDLAQTMWKKAGIRYILVGIAQETGRKFLKDRFEPVMKLENLDDTVFHKIARIIHPC